MNIVREIKFISVMLLYCTFSFSQTKQSAGEQNKTIDSHKLVLKNAKHDTIRINALYQWAKFIISNQPDEAIALLAKAQTLAEKNSAVNATKVNDGVNITLNELQNPNPPIGLKAIYLKKLGAILNKIGLAYYNMAEFKKALIYYNKSRVIYAWIKDTQGVSATLNNIAIVYYDKGQIKEALDYYQQSIKISENSGNKKSIANTLNNIANIYDDQGKIKEALDYHQQSLKIKEDIADKQGVAHSLNNIANIYSNQGQIKEALDYYRKSLKIREKIGDKQGVATSLNNIAEIYYQQGQVEEALDYYQKSLKIREKIGDKQGVATSLNNIAEIYYQQGHIKEVLDYYKQSLKIQEDIGNKQGIANSLKNIAKIYYDQGQIKSALELGVKSLDLSKELGFPELIMEGASVLKTIYQKQNNSKKALEMYELYITMRDSVNNEENRKASYKSHLQYEYGKKALADSIKSIDEKKISSAQLAGSQAKLKQEKTQKFALYAGLFLILIFTGFIYNRFKNSQRQKQLIEKQKLVVDESQRKIIASINYAKKIQTSMLPSQEEMTASFKENFVFFKPKDIVSGDFYWFHNADNCSYIAVADCTGHGVPGAFMTMIAHSILNEVVVEQKITSPDLILNNLHSLIFKALKQHKGDEYSQDGMDLSFVKIDHKNKLLTFAGARNNGFLINNSEIEILKATSKSIGGLSLLGEAEPERKFKSETFQIKENSTLILTTDGIFDQLNDEDKKFGTNRFKEMILKLNAGQENVSFLETTFNEWKKTTPQLDDILLVGLKV